MAISSKILYGFSVQNSRASYNGKTNKFSGKKYRSGEQIDES
jgi:hypothetical protein